MAQRESSRRIYECEAKIRSSEKSNIASFICPFFYKEQIVKTDRRIEIIHERRENGNQNFQKTENRFL